MDNEIFVNLFERISETTDSAKLFNLSMEAHKAVVEKTVTDKKEIIILMLSLQVQSLVATMFDPEKKQSQVYAIMGDAGKDYEQTQLEEMYAEELENFRKGQIFTMESLVLEKRK